MTEKDEIASHYHWPPPVSPTYADSLPCGSCRDGWMIERHGKHGIFWGCTNYPTCLHSMNANDVYGALGILDPDETDMWEQEF